MIPSTEKDNEDEDCPDVDWEHKLQSSQCVFIHSINVEAALRSRLIHAMKIVRMLEVVRRKENGMVHSDNVGI